MRRWRSVLLWSVVAAAFVGPGTVTTAAAAGSGWHVELLWAVAFSALACFVLQEMAARLTAVSGLDLGQALRRRFPSGWMAGAVLTLVVGAVVLGCAAYQGGNLLGATAGMVLGFGWSPAVATAVLGIVAAALLWAGSPRAVAQALSVLVALMGGVFLITALSLWPGGSAVARGLLVPSLPAGATLVVLGLVGTTVVPYNLFLGSSLARGEGVGEMRTGLGIAVGLGGLVTMAVLLAGTAVTGTFEFAALAEALQERIALPARTVLGIGLMAAGLTSAVTAPLAAALTAKSLFAADAQDPRWGVSSWRYRAVWLGVLLAGLAVAWSGVRPVPAIILAQAFNGIILPVVAVFLWLVVNDRKLLGGAVNSAGGNVLAALVVGVAILLGVAGLARAVASLAGEPLSPGWVLAASAVLVFALLPWLVRELVRARREP